MGGGVKNKKLVAALLLVLAGCDSVDSGTGLDRKADMEDFDELIVQLRKATSEVRPEQQILISMVAGLFDAARQGIGKNPADMKGRTFREILGREIMQHKEMGQESLAMLAAIRKLPLEVDIHFVTYSTGEIGCTAKAVWTNNTKYVFTINLDHNLRTHWPKYKTFVEYRPKDGSWQIPSFSSGGKHEMDMICRVSLGEGEMLQTMNLEGQIDTFTFEYMTNTRYMNAPTSTNPGSEAALIETLKEYDYLASLMKM